MIDNRIVGRRIAAMRQEKGLTQQQLAGLMSVSHQAVSKWESGQALPDIQTMLELTRFFGITVEQLIGTEEISVPAEEKTDVYDPEDASDNNEQVDETQPEEGEVTKMSIQQLLQMAPYMSKETVEEIVMEMQEELSAQQIARVAPYIHPECVEKLIKKHRPELNWDVLRRIAPYMRREAVDELARAIASGRETVKPAGDNINKTINDIGKAIDDIGRGVGKAMKKAIRFGECVIDEVSSAINDLSSEAKVDPAPSGRSERAAALRKKAFERALEDGKWDWLGEHISEIAGDSSFQEQIAQKARAQNMHDWICRYMGSYADEHEIEDAIKNENWNWLGENIRALVPETQQKAALAAMRARNWKWLADYTDCMQIDECVVEIAESAVENGERKLAAQLTENHMTPAQAGKFAQKAIAADDFEMLDLIACLLTDENLEMVLLELAEKRDWESIEKYIGITSSETVEALLERAVEQGDFDAVDMLDDYL